MVHVVDQRNPTVPRHDFVLLEGQNVKSGFGQDRFEFGTAPGILVIERVGRLHVEDVLAQGRRDLVRLRPAG